MEVSKIGLLHVTRSIVDVSGCSSVYFCFKTVRDVFIVIPVLQCAQQSFCLSQQTRDCIKIKQMDL